MRKADREHLAQVAALGCIACLKDGYEDTPAEIHHIREGYGRGERAPHTETIPLCPIHHRFGYKDPKTGEVIPAVHTDYTAFVERYGTERELLAEVRDALCLT